MIERFIALPINSVSRVPEAPTSAPATIRTLLCSTKPVAEAASPVKALSSEITTGMSAPPIGRTNMHAEDERRDDEAVDQPLGSPPAAIQTPSTTAMPMISALTICWPRNTIGRPEISSCSLANATSDPENEIEPISAESAVEVASTVARPAGEAVELVERDQRCRAAADPVEEGHHLRHRGHLHRARADQADGAADRHRDRDQAVVAEAVLGERDDDRERHPGARRSSSPCARASATRGSAARG